MSFSVIIPARYGSERLPGKPLLDLAGKPMIQRVYEQAAASDAERVIVATDDERIARVVENFGGRVRMTAPDHPSGTDRLQEAARLEDLSDADVVVNVQGDEPLMPPEVINQVARNLLANDVPMATLTETIDNVEDIFNPNVVKVVSNTNQLAVYFSRAPIPWFRDEWFRD
ncbi:MAG: 3-deoxy-manno-octulosonate cytidylyltransferase, partial [Pseudomonadales bacterium]